VKIQGLEAKGEAKLPIGFGVRAAASYAKGSVRTVGVAGSMPLDSIDPVKLVGGLFYQPDASPFRAELVATHAAGKKVSRTNNSCNTATTACFTPSGFLTLDATASLRLLNDHATVRVGIFNITDRKYFWWSDVRGLASTSPIRDAYSQPGRNAGASLTFTL
jgi:hemoglobin/transferrin/lactoferrin receptor protein